MRQKAELRKENGVTTLYVDGKPFVALGGELHNSASSSTVWMREKVWPSLRPLHVNSVIATVSWEQIEPEEGVFDFTELDDLIADAGKEGVRLTLIWFGLWKNGTSTYVPEWVKLDRDRYWVCESVSATRIPSPFGDPSNTISPLCQAAVDADARAYARLMKHIGEVDTEGTVIMMQVENEMGLLGSPRDFSSFANARFAEEIPAELAESFGISGTWTEAFGRDAEEYFMAWYYGRAVETIISAGKKEHDILMYVNAWLQQYPDRPGCYPSGCPIAKMIPLWRIAAPGVCLYAPDIYVQDFEKVAAEYSQLENPLFIPETATNINSAASVFLAVCEYNAIGFHPFGIEDIISRDQGVDAAMLAALNISTAAFKNEGSAVYLPASYQVLHSMMHLIIPARGTGHMRGFYHNGFDNGIILEFEEYDVHIAYGPTEQGTPPAGGAVLEVAPNEFYVFGTNFRAWFLPKKGENCHVQFLRIEEGTFEGETWKRGRILNGDEHYVGLPFMPGIMKVKLYKY
ncbi:MAG: hypothetical protein E7463_03840 [Ruminococcaceae bacterium]|nr:hypothetical protein [Oscillospiraceae bacterium]